jgi:diketogulonate reductase-like aldo/keto reductase
MTLDRRRMLQLGAGAVAGGLLGAGGARAAAPPPSVGLGTWITFNVGGDPVLLDRCVEVMRAFFEEGGGMIDSSPMYGSSQDTVGHGLARLGRPEALFSAEKVWTSSAADGPQQMARTRRKWGVPRFDLMQVHNLRAAEGHLETLFEMKAAGELGAVGVTTSHGRRHGELERVMRRHPLDYVQLTYNILDREPERRLLPLARERGIRVIANRPYRRGALIRRFAGAPLPGWAGDIGVSDWPGFLLKFIISHPDVTVAIPATTNPAHLRANKAAARGPMPDAALRRRMAAHVESL